MTDTNSEVALEAQNQRVWPEGDMLEAAWGIIANAFDGNWDDASPDWRQAAERWRDTYHAELAAHCEAST